MDFFSGKRNDTVRESGFELLRIIAIIGIVFMHTWRNGAGFENSIEPDWIVTVAENSIFNAGVTCFVLITGYFGINFHLRKLHSLHLIAVSYSVIAFVIEQVILGDAFHKTYLISAFAPVCTRKYWFLTCYIYLCVLSPLINRCINSISKKELFWGICSLVVVFYAIPTVFFFAPDTMGDSGKGLANMITVYLIGRYIRINAIEWSKRKCLLIMLGAWVVNFAGSAALSYIVGKGAYFCRDCSLSMLVFAISIFMYFKRIKLKSKIINVIAANVFVVYIFSEPIRRLYVHIFAFLGGGYTNITNMLVAAVFLVFLQVATCIVIELIRKMIFGKIDEQLVCFLVSVDEKCIKSIVRKESERKI